MRCSFNFYSINPDIPNKILTADLVPSSQVKGKLFFRKIKQTKIITTPIKT